MKPHNACDGRRRATHSIGVRASVARLRIAGADERLSGAPLTGGVSSNILRVELPSGPVCVKQALPKLKVAKDWEAPTSRVFAEIDWLGIAQRIVPGCVPRVLGADRERGAFVMEYLEERANWKAELLAGRIDVGVAEGVATAVVSVHRATAGDPAVARSFRYDGTFFAIRLEPYLVEAARVHPDLATELIGLVHVTQTTPRALVHGDISPKNILLDRTSRCCSTPNVRGTATRHSTSPSC